MIIYKKKLIILLILESKWMSVNSIANIFLHFYNFWIDFFIRVASWSWLLNLETKSVFLVCARRSKLSRFDPWSGIELYLTPIHLIVPIFLFFPHFSEPQIIPLHFLDWESSWKLKLCLVNYKILIYSWNIEILFLKEINVR